MDHYCFASGFEASGRGAAVIGVGTVPNYMERISAIWFIALYCICGMLSQWVSLECRLCEVLASP